MNETKDLIGIQMKWEKKNQEEMVIIINNNELESSTDSIHVIDYIREILSSNFHFPISRRCQPVWSRQRSLLQKLVLGVDAGPVTAAAVAHEVLATPDGLPAQEVAQEETQEQGTDARARHGHGQGLHRVQGAGDAVGRLQNGALVALGPFSGTWTAFFIWEKSKYIK